eukprot:4193969-Alexandrium_andersonii.AAC.1
MGLTVPSGRRWDCNESMTASAVKLSSPGSPVRMPVPPPGSAEDKFRAWPGPEARPGYAAELPGAPPAWA